MKKVTTLIACFTIFVLTQAQAQVWTESFESNWTDRWYVDNGVWNVGTPTIVGPSNAHGGVSCAATVLNGNYPDDKETRLIRKFAFTIPSLNQNPRLRFWQWFSFSTADLGRVQIKTPTGVWTNLTSYTYYNTCSNAWTVEEIDLSKWADSTVQIAFYFYSHNADGNNIDVSSGWYVDDLEIRTGAFTFNNQEGFESGIGDWSVERGSWETGAPSSGPGAAHTGVNCAATRLSGNYDDDVDTRLRSTWFTIPSLNQNPRLRFWQWFSFSTADLGRVQIKTPTGVWTNLTSYTYYNTCSNVWTVEEIDLSKWADSTVQIAFYFYSHNADGNNIDVSSGWYVDDLEIRTGAFTFNNQEGFESGIGDWSVERGSWETGAPSSGPGAAHTGVNCAATRLSGNYDDDVDTRLRSTWFTIPSLNQNPRLRFWQWFSFSTADLGRVQIKTPTGVWTNLTSYTYYNTCSNAWTVEEIDLSKWADSTVQIAFYFYSHNADGNNIDVSSGWYVDDLEIRTGAFTFNNQEGFESGIGDWSVERGSWETGAPSSGPGAAHTGVNCAATRLSGNYDDDVDTRLRSPWITLPSASLFPSISFWHWFSFSTSDNGRVQIRTLHTGWQDISTIFSGISSTWSYYYLPLTSWADSTVQIAFYFYSHNANGNNIDVSSGWYVDDIYINAVPVASIIGPTTVCKNSTETYTANIGYASYNWGLTGGTIQSGQGTPSVSVKWTSTGNKSISLSVIDAIYSDSLSLPVTVNPIPTASITTSDPITFCKPDTATLLANSGSGLSYQWKKGGNLVTGATSISYAAIASANYKCMVTNSFGCSKTSNLIAVVANPKPTAQISTSDPTTFCSTDSAVLAVDTGINYMYQWKLGSSNIVGATKKNYTAKVAGTYKCKVTDINGCSKTSSGIKITVPCRNEGVNIGDDEVFLYPNPTNGMITLNFNSAKYQSGEIIFTDLLGREIMQDWISAPENKNEYTLDIGSFAAGVYLLKLKTPAGEQVLRVVKE